MEESCYRADRNAEQLTPADLRERAGFGPMLRLFAAPAGSSVLAFGRWHAHLAMNADVWNVLHDGPIVRITGSIPGDVQFAVSIGYLRRRFADAGDCILLTLHGCTAISYQTWDSDSVVTDLASIAAAEPEILSADEPTTVFCANGTLRVHAADFSLALDSGRAITLDELCSVAAAYWTEWSERAPKTTT